MRGELRAALLFLSVRSKLTLKLFLAAYTSLRETIRSLVHRGDAAETGQSEVEGQEVPAYEGGGGGSSSMGKPTKRREPPIVELLLRQDVIEALLEGASAEEGRVWSTGDLSRGQRFRVLFRSVEAGEEM